MNIGLTKPEGLTQYDVKRTSTDKLEVVLNAYGEGWTVTQVTFVGGRDWVVIAKAEYDSEAERDERLD